MTRRARLSATLLILACLALLPSGCKEDRRPPIQTQPPKTTGAGPAEEVVEPPTPDEKKIAAERLDKAIMAHGGPERLRRLRAHVQILKGTFDLPQVGTVPTEQELIIQFPDRLKLTVKYITDQGAQTTVMGLNGPDGWLFYRGQVRDMEGDEHHDVMEEVQFRRILTILPLRDEEFVLRPIDGQPVSSRSTVGLRVGSKGHPAVNLFFDADTGLLLRSSGRFREGGVAKLREITLSDHKAIDGVKLPTRFVDTRDGRKLLDCSVEYKFISEIDAKELARPN